jgi:regulator of protease activity HflC (stomatin/prohibitin superfamily)
VTYAALIQPVLWLIAIGTAAFFVGRAFLSWRRKQSPKRSLIYVGAALLAVFVVVPAIGVVPAGSRGVVYRWNGGVDPRVRGEGVTFIVPWFQHLTVSSVRTQKVYSSKVFAQSADLQEITVVASVNFHVDPDRAAYLYQHVGQGYQSIVVQPALFQRTKAAVGQIKAIDFAIERDTLANTIQTQLTSQLAGYGIVVEYVNIEDAIFDPRFVEAVKAKVIAKQNAQEQFNLIAARTAVKQQTIIDAEATARSVLIQATAQAKANQKISASVTPALLRWQWLVVWNGTLPSTLVGKNAGGLLLSVPTATP